MGRSGKHPSRRVETLAGVAVVAAAGFATTAVATGTRASAHFDRKLAPRLAPRPRTRRRRIAEAMSPVGKWYVILPAGVLGGALLARDRTRRVAGATIAVSPIIAFVLAKLFDHLLPQPPVPAGHWRESNKPVFPSGHAMMSMSVAPTAAYVLSREQLAHLPSSMAAAVLFSLVHPALKLAVRKHWPTDAIGGVAAGVAISAACCAAYEHLRDSR